MEALDLKEELTMLLLKEVGFTGKFILEKQCKHLNIDPQKINSDNLRPLAERIGWAIRGVTGEKRADEIKQGILEYRKALDTVTEALEGDRGDDPVAEIEALLTIAQKKLSLGMMSDAEAALRDAIKLLEDSDFKKKKVMEIKVRRQLARILSRRKETLEGAVKEYERLIETVNGTKYHYDVALAWNGLGAIAWRAGEHKRALDCYKKGLEAIERMPAPSKNEKTRKKSAEATIKSGLGNVCLDLLDMDAAIKNNEDAIELSKQLENWSEVGRIYNNLARVYEEMGQYGKAIDRYERGIQYSKDAGMLRMEGWTLTNLASTLIEAGRVPEALGPLERASKMLSDFDDPIAHSKLHCMWGKYYRELGTWSAAIEHFHKSIEHVKDENTPDYLAIAEEEFGTLYQKMGENGKAKKRLKSALAWYEKKEETYRIEKINKQLAAIGE